MRIRIMNRKPRSYLVCLLSVTAPKSLYIVPWKSSEIGVETSLDMMLNEGEVPVDRDVFKRQLEFYQVRNAK
jgi:hypothetical protein